jgi:protein-S-isoprenylcysteine O-methyltransferase Ste14
MYAGALVMLLGIPIALGSWWGLLVIAAMMPALIWRLIDEEKFLARNLPGYVEYQKKCNTANLLKPPGGRILRYARNEAALHSA